MLNKILESLQEAGGESFFVGGFVRDSLLGVSPKDRDLEVYNLSAGKVHEILSNFGNVDSVGMSFGILKFRDATGIEYDFSLPRRESKSGQGHRGFQVEADPLMSKREACARRDYTINAMMQDPFTGEIFDFFGGKDDLNNGILRATSEHFGDDVLRPLRGVQLCGRFNLKVEPKTAEICRSLRNGYKILSIERVWAEWEKFALKSIMPSAGLQFLIDTGWSQLYPEFHNNIGVKQNPKYHGEIFVELHTQMVCDAAVKIANRECLSNNDRLSLVMSALLHDCAKYKTSIGEYPDIKSPMHDILGEPLAIEFLERIGTPKWLINKVAKNVKNHMRHYNCASEKAVRKLAIDMEPSNINELCLLIEADYGGRGSTSTGLPDKAKKMLEISKQEKVHLKRQQRIIEGKHLKQLNIPTGPLYGTIINQAYDAQINSKFNTVEEGLQWLRDNKVLNL